MQRPLDVAPSDGGLRQNFEYHREKACGPYQSMRDIRWGRNVTILYPLKADALICLIVRDFIDVGHKDLHPGLGCHPSVPVHDLFLIPAKIEIEPIIF